MLYLGLFIFLIYAYTNWTLWRYYQTVPRIQPLPPKLPDFPRLSIIFAAKDEERVIRQCVNSLLNSNYPELEIIAVNDRSLDQTGTILDEIARSNSHLKVVHIRDLPADWLGKCYALSQGAQMASGEYLLFTDADIIFSPDALKLSLQHMREQKLQHLSLLPYMIVHSWVERALLSFFGVTFLIGMRSHLINSDNKTSYAGVGAFNMVEKKAYQKAGGHGKLRMTITDDVTLGRMMKDHNFRSSLIPAPELLRVKWQEGPLGLIKGLEKNAFASIDFSWPMLLGIIALFLLGHVFPYVAFFFISAAWSWPFILTLILGQSTFYYNSRHMGYTRLESFFNILAGPIPSLLYMWTLSHSAVITERQGGVRWRNTFYSKESLRRHAYPKSSA